MSRPQIGPRVHRMLTLIPWLKAHPEGVPIDEVCARFGVDRKRLLTDIDSLAGIGSEPYLPGDVIDVVVVEGRVFAYMPLSFTKPLRITPPQALALVASANAMLASTDDAAEDPLRRALTKLARTLGINTDEAVSVDLGTADSAHLEALRSAVAAGTQVELDYYSAGRDDRTTRTVDPFQVVSMGGHWYLSGWCHSAEGDRLFRVDRIAAVRVLDSAVSTHPDREALSPLHYDDTTPRVTLDVARSARWVVETFPVDRAEEREDGNLRVTLPVASSHWLLRLLLQWGPEIRVVGDPTGTADGLRELAGRVAARYSG